MFWCLILEQILIDIWKRFRSGSHILNAFTRQSYKSTGSLLCHLEITRQKYLNLHCRRTNLQENMQLPLHTTRQSERNYANTEEQEISLCVPKLKTNQNIMLKLILDSPKLYSERRGDIWIIHDPLEPKKCRPIEPFELARTKLKHIDSWVI